MKRHKLAKQLRERQKKTGMHSADIINKLTDTQIIDSFIHCSCCGELTHPRKVIGEMIRFSDTCEEFLDLLETDSWDQDTTEDMLDEMIKIFNPKSINISESGDKVRFELKL